MKNIRFVLLAVSLASFALIGAALYLQHVENMLPCPLCVIQRYAFAAVALLTLLGAFLPLAVARFLAGLSALAALTGGGVAIYHLWIKAHPTVSCGIDPLETSLNTIPTAKLLPFVFKADGLCTTEYAPIFGLSIPQWALIWFVAFGLMLTWLAFRRGR
jgi:protein dithiol:quinone oxidoreductase